jgi:hypothetical protein
MNGDMELTLKPDQAKELKGLVDAEIDRQLLAIHDFMTGHFTPAFGYKFEDDWNTVKAKIMAVVQSDLAQTSKGLGALVAASVPEPSNP